TPMDEETVHDSFNQLIAEQSQDGALSEAFELQELQRELTEEENDVSHLPGREHEPGGRGQRDVELGEDERATDPLIADYWSPATMRILSSMPSRTIGRNRGAIISQYYNRTMQLRRRRQSRPSIKHLEHSARPSIRGYGHGEDTLDAEVGKREQLVNNLRNLSVSDRVRMLREMPLSVAEKSELRRLALQKERDTQGGRKLHCCSRLKFYIIILWQVALKRVSGRFGTGVLSYFVFIKTLLLFNAFLCLVTGAFLVLPQVLFPPVPAAGRPPFCGLELLTGAGYFTDTVMYYGYYANYTLQTSCGDEDDGHHNASLSKNATLECTSTQLSYNMPLAYFFTIGVAFFITCIILVYSMSKSFGRSFRIEKSHGILAMKVFCSWDFKVIRETSVRIMSENICTQLKELLTEVGHKDDDTTLGQQLWRVAVHALAWTICIGSTAASVFSIYQFSEYMHGNLQESFRGSTQEPLLREASMLALPVLVSLINLLLPGLFNLSAWMEDYESPSVRTYVSIGRNLILKVSILGVLCYHWLGRVAADPQLKCWESFVGQELYRFLIMEFIFALLDTLFGELLWRLFSERVLKRRRKPVFDIARNVLELIYGQTLAWLGVLFTPLLPAVQILKLLLLFYIKKSSVMMNCQAPRKPYRVSQMTTIFITLLCFPSFLGASVCVTYTMWITPSLSCGPFRELKTMFQAGKRWVKDLEKANPNLSMLARAHSYLVEHPFFLFLGAGIFLIVIYFQSQVVDGHRKIISLLQEQIENEGEDKKFLVTRLQSIHEQKKDPKRRERRQ
uniref:Transmembrane channel-like protein n=1 Tax=Tetraodon nigroviridis TaxID=99883 RepID=H3D965_TETNG